MEKLNLQRQPIMLMRLFSLMAIHVKPGNELTSRQKNNASVKELKLNENSVTNSHELTLPIHLMITFQPLEPNLPMKYFGLVTDGSSYADYIVRSNNKFFFQSNQ